MKITKNRALFVIIAILFFYVGLAFYSDVQKIFEHFRSIKLELVFLAFLLEGISLIIRSIRQQRFLGAIMIRLSFFENLKIYLAGMSMVSTPGGIGGLIKSHFLKVKYNENISKTSTVVLLERYHDLLAVTAILIFTLFIFFNWQFLVTAIAVGILAIIIYAVIRNTEFLSIFLIRMKKIKIFSKFTPNQEFNNSLKTLTKGRTIFVGFIISIAAFLFDGASVYVGFLSLNKDLGFVNTIQYYYTSLLLGALSFLPAGIGITEGSFIGFLVSRGLELSLASSLVLFSRLTTIWFATVIGFIATHRITLKKTITDDSTKKFSD